MSRTWLALGLSVATLTVVTCTSAALAQKGVAKACAADVKAQCAGVQPGEGRIKACIKSHVKDLAEPCQAVMLKAAAIGKPCAPDVKQNCAGIRPGDGGIEACMKAHLNEGSEPCKEVLSQAAAGRG